MPDDAALRDTLRSSIQRSRQKRYHGYETEINDLPKIEDQTVNYISSKSDPFAHYDEAKKTFLDGKDPKWKDLLLQKFDWIKNIEDTKGPAEYTPQFFA